MRNRKRKNRGGSMLEFALLCPVWVTLLLGTLWYGSAMIRGLQVTQIARDFASMYCRGVDFSTAGTPADPSAQDNILPKITSELGSLSATGGPGVVIFSTITYVGAGVCALGGDTYYDKVAKAPRGACTNWKYFVFTQRYTVGKSSLRASNFGAPDSADLDKTNYSNIDLVKYLAHSTDRVPGFTLLPNPDVTAGGYRSGQPVYIVEAFFTGTSQAGYGSGGAYAYAIF